MSEIFFNFLFYELQRDQIALILEECEALSRTQWNSDEEKKDNESQEELLFDDVMASDIAILQGEKNEYERLSPFAQNLYEWFVEEVDKIFGMQYRRDIQYLLHDTEYIPKSVINIYKNELKNNHGDHVLAREKANNQLLGNIGNCSINVLYLLEKIIVGKIPIEEGFKDIPEFIATYLLKETADIEYLLLVAFTYEHASNDTVVIELIASRPSMLQFPYVMYILMEMLSYCDEEEYDTILQRFDEICLEINLGDKGFIAFIEENTRPTEENIAEDSIVYMYLARWHMNIINWQDEKALELFAFVWDNYGVSSWYIYQGDMLTELDRYTEALQSYINAYTIQPNIESLMRILDASLESADFDTTQKYILLAIQEGYDVSWYIFARYLWIRDYDKAFDQLLRILFSNGNLDISFPDSYRTLLEDVIKDICSNIGTSLEWDILAMKSLYIYLELFAEEKGEFDQLEYLYQIDFIRMLMEERDLNRVFDMLIPAVQSIGWVLDIPEDMGIEDQITFYINNYLILIYQKICAIHKKNIESGDTIKILQTFEAINNYIKWVLIILKRFHYAEHFMATWWSAINMKIPKTRPSVDIHDMPTTMQ